jgi:hypothetical protein
VSCEKSKSSRWTRDVSDRAYTELGSITQSGLFAVSDDHGCTISRILQHFGSCVVFLGVSLPLHKRQLFEMRNQGNNRRNSMPDVT